MRYKSIMRPIAAGVLSSLVMMSSQLHADDTPLLDPGAEQRQLERDRPDTLRPSPELRFDIPDEPPMRAVADRQFDVSGFVFQGNTIFPADELAGLINDMQGTISFVQLLEATSRITKHYREAGYIVARAYVPEQAIENGQVRIAVLEGVLGAIRVEGDSPISEQRVRAHLARLENTGIINEADLEYGALLLNDLPGLRAEVALRPGERTGTSDVVLNVIDEGTYDFSVDYNNFGSPVTGEHRLGMVAGINNIFDVGDRLTIRPMLSDSGDTFYGSLRYELPVFTPASRVGLSFSHLLSELGEDFEDLEIENTATTISLYGSHAFVRSRDRNITGRLAFENRNFVRDIGAPSITQQIEKADYVLNVADLSVSGDYRDDFYGGALSTYSASLRFGLSDVKAEDGGAAANDDPRFEGKFALLNFSAQRVQRLRPLWSASVRLDGQFSGDSLDTSERMSLGGPQAVRAYRPSEALGDSALILQTEVRRELPSLAERYDWLNRAEAYGLFDMGTSEINSPLAINADESWTRNGIGAGMRIAAGNSFYADLTVATRLADRESIVDQSDDSKVNYWLQMIYWF
ncbi:MAG: ShlB/FhaC/HecB family hemolysin secretion/activation protein [Alcanivoracaceae bacterium]|jgi:hemolysin activation/secretion protein|nr:ShlB/FhaC/HecB family hemolysin secretion/activation protein [Alcanivoracaceae bacterium]